MKITKFLLTALICIIMLPLSQAQKIYEDDISMSLGVQNALYVELDKSDRKNSEKMWKSYVKDYGKTKQNKKAKEWYTLAAKIPAITIDDNVDVYSKFEEMGDMTRAYFWFDIGGAFVNSIDYEQEAEGAEMFIKDFALMVKKEVISKELEDQEDKLKKIQKELSNLEKDNRKYHEEIEKSRKKIAEKEQDIEKNLVDQEQTRTEIATQQKVVEEIIERLNNIRKN